MNGKKVIVLGMTLMFITLLSWPAYGAFNDISQNPYQEAIEEVASLGILKGYGDGSFGPSDTLSRAQAAKVAGYLLGYTEEDAQAASQGAPLFPDVYLGMGSNEWAVGWINLVAEKEVIRGYAEDGRYHPERTLEMVQWGAILMRILGHEEEDMAWPADYDQKSEELGLNYRIPYQGSDQINRGQMAQTVYSAIYRVADHEGEFLKDRIDFEDSGGDETQEPVSEPDGLVIDIEGTPGLLKAGGGEQAAVIVTVREDGLPVEGAPVYFAAEAGGSDRTSQLSQSQTQTDSQGQATITYTTLAGDDERHVEIGCTVFVSEESISKSTTIFASDSAGIVTGVVENPFDGSRVSDAEINLFDPATHTSMIVSTDEGGEYAAYVSGGEYALFYQFKIQGSPGYDGKNYSGSFYEIQEGELRYQQPLTVVEGNSYTRDSDRGILKGVLSNPGEGVAIAVYELGNKETVLADVNPDGSFLVPLDAGNYDVMIMGGALLKQGITLEKGTVLDLGNLS
ncbi:MAG: hypothetical protein AVO33_06535 [delta proteobacterium ML8_F1]|nr:MAG: hypothetical protein AVO33_06535 [delta proteobacterium ML8_F1]